jgi:hypothetical protein
VPSGAFGCLIRVPSGALVCLRVPSGALGCLRVPSGAFGCLRMLSGALGFLWVSQWFWPDFCLLLTNSQ